MIAAWLASLNEDQIASWANKGLLRRGKKVLESNPDMQCQLHDHSASASIDGHQQHLDAVGFDQLQCDCAAFGPCHHLTAFLLGLQVLANENFSGQNSATESNTARPAALPTPWLDGEPEALEKALGKANIRTALQLLNRGDEAELELTDTELLARMDLREEFQIRIPRQGGLAASLCSCKTKRCSHRALTVLQARQEAGLPIPELSEPLLSEHDRHRLSQVQQWLRALVLQGSNNLGNAYIDQGDVLATELRQIDMPRPARALLALVERLRQQQQRQSDVSAKIADQLANVWLLINALQQTPLPRPWKELAGEHRQQYRLCRNRNLQAEALECWQSPRGNHGFTCYLRDLDNNEILSWSQARPQQPGNQNLWEENWEPRQAWKNSQLANVPLTAMLTQPYRLVKGWSSREGRLSGRDGTSLTPLQQQPDYPASDYNALLQKLNTVIQHDPWQPQPLTFAWLEITRCQRITAEAGNQTWQLHTSNQQGLMLLLQGRMDRYGRKVRDRLEARLLRNEAIKQVFGLVWLQHGLLHMRPISLISAQQPDPVHLTL
jgi:hypothetical protein